MDLIIGLASIGISVWISFIVSYCYHLTPDPDFIQGESNVL